MSSVGVPLDLYTARSACGCHPCGRGRLAGGHTDSCWTGPRARQALLPCPTGPPGRPSRHPAQRAHHLNGPSVAVGRGAGGGLDGQQPNRPQRRKCATDVGAAVRAGAPGQSGRRSAPGNTRCGLRCRTTDCRGGRLLNVCRTSLTCDGWPYRAPGPGMH